MWHQAVYHHHYTSHGGWFLHTIISAVIHGIIYGLIFKLFKEFSLQEDLLISGGIIAFVMVFYWFFLRKR